MHTIEPFWSWRDRYQAEQDSKSPFFGKEYSEFEFTNQIYDHLVHPQWDDFGSETLFIKILFIDYERQFAIIEFMGEWNDLLYNDIQTLKREVIDHLIEQGIIHYILIGENIFNYHASDDSYYEEWFEDIDPGWICSLNLRHQVLDEMAAYNIDQYFLLGGKFEDFHWRSMLPQQLFNKISELVQFRLNP